MNFEKINEQALEHFDDIINTWLPDGKFEGSEYVAINPKRNDGDYGSFKINSETGLWADFALDDEATGGDLVSLIAYLEGSSQSAAARRLEEWLRDPSSVAPQLVTEDGEELVTQPDHAAAAETDGDEPGGQLQTVAVRAEPNAVRTKSPTRDRRRRHSDADLQWVQPVPDERPPVPQKHPRLGKPSAHWMYRDASGAALFYICRFDRPDGGKEVLPLSLWCEPSGNLRWRFKAVPEPRPLYGLDRLAQRPEAPVLVVEGEKAADAAAKLFPGHVVVTTPGGSKAAGKADLRPLFKRSVWIWPDYDHAGYNYALAVGENLLELDRNAEIQIMRPVDVLPSTDDEGHPSLENGFEPPRGWDAADALEMGWTSEHIALLADEQWVVVELTQDGKIQPNQDRMPNDFVLNKEGVWYLDVRTDRDGNEVIKEIWLSSPIRVIAKSRDESGHNWGTQIEFEDHDGQVKRWCFDDDLPQQPGHPYRATLASMGAKLAPGGAETRYLAEYLVKSRPTSRLLSVRQPGWHREVFVLPDQLFGGEEGVVFQTNNPLDDNIYSQAGTLRGWQDQVARPCSGNPRAVFAISAALAGPLLRELRVEGGGFHYRGPSSLGKSILLRIAASVWGGEAFVGSWRATDNGLEGTAALRNDTVLILDELAEIEARVAGEAAYMLANGRGKARATRTGGIRRPAQWRTLLISSGEVSLATHMATAGQRARAGQELRLVDIPADAGQGFGVFDRVPDGYTSAAFAEQMRDCANTYFGTAGRAWLEILTDAQNRQDLVQKVEAVAREFRRQCVSSTVAGQVQRVCGRFALVAGAGEIAIEAGLLPWQPGEAFEAARACFMAWLGERDDTGESERLQVIAQVRRFIERHGDARFDSVLRPESLSLPDRVVGNRAGFVKGVGDDEFEYWVLPEVFRREVCEGFSSTYVCQVLEKEGYLTKGADGFTRSERIPKLSKSKRVYVLTPALMRDGAPDSDSTAEDEGD